MRDLGPIAILCGVACVSAFVSFAVFQNKTESNHIQREFHDACIELRGKVVWNGKHWECLK